MALLFEEESHAILGACFEVHNQMGAGFLEDLYQECLKVELRSRGCELLSKPRLKLHYKGIQLEQYYDPDFLCFGKIILEIKAISSLADIHRAHVLNYLKAAQFRLGLLVNFHSHPKWEFERIIN
ncbi:MAG: GxxExxY protein [Planctomycetaceae bacterium]